MHRVRSSIFTVIALLTLSAYAEEVDLSGFDDEPVAASQEQTSEDDGLMDGFDDTPVANIEEKKSPDDAVLDGFEDTTPVSTEIEVEKSDIVHGLTGELTQQVAYSYKGDEPHDNFTSLRSTLFLDYEHKFENGFRVKVNAKAYYDTIYLIKGRDKFTEDELIEL